ncbi:MAG: type II toxin-antitoxin system HicA family toxin [Lachnospiraceae bacterium]|nr:type II toxin-antitoxin system HicA family toxin [Lachnospiraceae bacterium]
MKSISSKEIIKRLKDDGWVEVRVSGSHHQFRHSIKKGTVTVKDPDKDVPKTTVKSIERQSGIKFLR